MMHRIVYILLVVHYLFHFSCKESPSGELSLGEQMIFANDQVVAQYLERQNVDTLSQNYGGLPNQYELYNPGAIAGFFERLTIAFCDLGSEYYQSEELINRMKLAINFLLRMQYPDGTIDLITTNFHSTPDLAFTVEKIALSHKILSNREEEQLSALLAKTEQFLKAGGEALLVGGIHTPNHRWVVCMSLSRLFELFADDRYASRIDKWLAEGIDMDADGQYHEKSTAVYSPLSNRCLITVARIMDRPELLDHVRQNLNMTPFLIHPNGEIVTEISNRQDQYRARKPRDYYYPYRFMAVYDQSSVYAGMVQFLEKNIPAASLAPTLLYFMEDPLAIQTSGTDSIPTSYQRFFPDNDLYRIRSGAIDLSILAGNSTVITCHKRNAVLQAIRMASAFFGKAQFIADTMYLSGDSIILRQELEGPYYQPFENEKFVVDSSWTKSRKRRQTSEVQHLVQKLSVYQLDSAFMLDWQVTGTDRVPLAIELSFRNAGQLNGVEPIEGLPDCYLMKDTIGQYRYENASISFGPFLRDHSWAEIRGAEPKFAGQSVFLTGFTPFRYTLTLE